MTDIDRNLRQHDGLCVNLWNEDAGTVDAERMTSVTFTADDTQTKRSTSLDYCQSLHNDTNTSLKNTHSSVNINEDYVVTWLKCTKYSAKRKEWTKPNFFQPALDTHGLRRHSQILFKPRCRTPARKTVLSNRIIDKWKRLPQYVIDSSSVNVFENRLDGTWEDWSIDWLSRV